MKGQPRQAFLSPREGFSVHTGEEYACQRDSISSTCRLITAQSISPLSRRLSFFFFFLKSFSLCFLPSSSSSIPSIKPDISPSGNYSDDCRVKLVLLPTATFHRLRMSDELSSVITTLQGDHISHLVSTSRLPQNFALGTSDLFFRIWQHLR